MASNIIKAVIYFFKCTVRPGKTITELKSIKNKLAIAFYIAFIFALFYSITAFLIHLSKGLPAIEPWIPIAENQYYLYQTFWTIPWALTTWIILSGVAHLLSVLGKPDPYKYKFEDALVVVSLVWVIPSFYLMWIPETFILIPFNIVPPFEVELVRLMVIPSIWQIVLTAIGLRITHDISWWKGAIIGIVTVILSFIMFIAFMR